MRNTRPTSNNKIINETKAYKICAGKDCVDAGIKLLKIIYIKKSGWFCDACAEEMRESGLIDYTASNMN